MSNMTIPGSAAPQNLHLAGNVNARMIDGDVLDICKRIREIDPALFILELTDDADNCAFAIMEKCADGVDRLVYKAPALDQRILKRVERMKAIPFEKRFAEIEAEVAAAERERKEQISEEFYENLGIPMLKQFEHDGFIDRNVSARIPGKL